MLEQDGARIDARAHSSCFDKGVLRSKRAQSSLFFLSSFPLSLFSSLLACVPLLCLCSACLLAPHFCLHAFSLAPPCRHCPLFALSHSLRSPCIPPLWSMNTVNKCPEHPWGQGAYGTSPRLFFSTSVWLEGWRQRAGGPKSPSPSARTCHSDAGGDQASLNLRVHRHPLLLWSRCLRRSS